MAGKTISVIGNFVVELHLLFIFGDYRQRLAVVACLQVTRSAAFDRRRSGVFQDVGSEHNISFGSNEGRLQLIFWLIGVMTLDAGAGSLAIGSVILNRVGFVIEGDLAPLIIKAV